MPSGDESTSGEPQSLGAFRIIARLGATGNSAVYVGERMEGFSQRVAIKLLPEVTLISNEELDREQRVLASLEHPNIVRLLDKGTSERGRGYLVMEYITGDAIDRYCDEKRLTIAERAALLIKVMAAVSHAHHHLVVHADLKPSNILVDAQGEPKLLDFGISSLLTESATPNLSFYTPDFASPEQRRNEALTVATDVYSLGVLAFLLFAGCLPFCDDSAVNDGDSDVPLASARLREANGDQRKSFAERRSTRYRPLVRALQGDLDAILSKAMHPDISQRYLTVEAFKSDLVSYLAGSPVSARPATLIDRALKWMRRHKVIAISVTALTAIVLLSAIGTAVQTERAARQRSAAQTRLHELVRLTGVLDGELYDSTNPLQHAEATRDSLIKNVADTLDKLAGDNGDDPELSLQLAQQYEKLARLQLAQNPADRARGSKALADVDKGIALLNHNSSFTSKDSNAQRTLVELKDLKQSIPHP
ncbi:MAG: serine/threonine-protein kinase [Terracidiphilus sp.]|jgi:serine/threonine protein kinase